MQSREHFSSSSRINTASNYEETRRKRSKTIFVCLLSGIHELTRGLKLVAAVLLIFCTNCGCGFVDIYIYIYSGSDSRY